jgi:hypothetical protein
VVAAAAAFSTSSTFVPRPAVTLHEKMASEVAQFAGGRWNMMDSEHFDEYMKAVGKTMSTCSKYKHIHSHSSQQCQSTDAVVNTADDAS